MRALWWKAEDSVVEGGRVAAALAERGWVVQEAGDELELLAGIRADVPEWVVVQGDLLTSEMLAAARHVRRADERVTLVFVLARCEASLVLSAMRAGVNDLLTDDSSPAEIDEAIGRARGGWVADAPKTTLRNGERLVGGSWCVEQVRRAIERVALSDSNVLITGETGTGKELTAELIHRNSKRRDRPFVSLNCAAIPEGLLESELFGYERGAFTGAHAAREGKLQYAQGGTLFLDEIGDMSLYAQAKILRAIESRKVQRLGGNREIAVNIRIIAATNQNLEQLTSQQKFRQDLYFRLNVARLHLPPLREHTEDIPALVAHLARELAETADRRIDDIDSSFFESLLQYDWPGNVRELRNVVESTLVFCHSTRVTRRDLPPYLRALFASEERKRESEREKVLGALRASGWNRNDAARILGCSRMTLYRKMVKYDLFPHAEEPGAYDRNASA